VALFYPLSDTSDATIGFSSGFDFDFFAPIFVVEDIKSFALSVIGFTEI